MSSRNHQLRRSGLRKEKRKRHRTKQRRPRNPPITDQKPKQSVLSRRWIGEAPEKGMPSKLEAIYKVQEESEAGKDVSTSMPYLEKLISDPEKEVSLSAAFAAGACARNGTDPDQAIHPLVDLLHSKDDLTVETAIESLAECARYPSRSTRKMLLNKLASINKDGAPNETKANAGFALADIIGCAEDIVCDKEMRRTARSLFMSLMKSRENPCRLAGVRGIGAMAIAISNNASDPSLNEKASTYLKMFPIDDEDLIMEVVLGSIRTAGRIDRSNLTPGILQGTVRSLVSAKNEENIGIAADILEISFDRPEDRLHIMKILADWKTRGKDLLEKDGLAQEALGLLDLEEHDQGQMARLSGLVETVFSQEQKELLATADDEQDLRYALREIFKVYLLEEEQKELVSFKQAAIQRLMQNGSQRFEEKGIKLHVRSETIIYSSGYHFFGRFEWFLLTRR